MGLIKLLIVILILWGIYVLITKISKPNPLDEHYGGGQQVCEDACFSSPYYDACMNSCLDPTGASDFTGQGLLTYSMPGVASPLPLEDERADQLVVTHGNPEYRYDYPGH